MNRFDADRDYDEFETWFHELSDEKFGQLMLGWLNTVQAGTKFTRDGYDTCKGWALENRWPEIRMARELDELVTRTEAARLAA
jgi:hypothetical protein